jgi:hypothetical protein
MRIKFSACLCAATLALVAGPAANAAITVTIDESGGNVVTAFRGSFNLDGLTNAGTFSNLAPRLRANPFFYSGVTVSDLDLTGWRGMTGPTSLGLGNGLFEATSASGDLFAFNAFFPGGSQLIFFSNDYVSGSTISGGSVFGGQTLASLGLAAGTFVYTSEFDTLTFVIGGSVIPEPASWAMLIAGFGLVGAAARRRRIGMA